MSPKNPTGLFALLAAIGVLAFCTRPDYSNPLDHRSTDYVGDEAAEDSDGDGTANLYDPDSPLFHVTDTIAPVLSVSGGDTIIIAQGDPDNRLRAITVQAIDETDGDLSEHVVRQGTFFTSRCSTFTVGYTVQDFAGNTAHLLKLIVVDCEGPRITLIGDNPLFFDVGQTYIDPGVTAEDNIDGSITELVITNKAVSTATEHVDTVIYSASDRAGYVTTITRIVKVESVIVPNETPTITLNGSTIIIRIGEAFSDPGAVAHDPEDGDITGQIVVTGTVNTNTVGVDTLVYSVTDQAGKSASTVRVVRVVDNTSIDMQPPWIELQGESVMSISVGQSFLEPGFIAGDNIDGAITSSVVVSGTVNASIAGTFLLTYSVADAAGNTTSVSRIVHVVMAEDTEAPTLTLQGAVLCTVSVGERYSDPGAIAIDGVDGIISNKVVRVVKDASGLTVDTSTFTSTIGRFSLAYSVSDNAGNAAVLVTRTVLVVDTAGGPVGDLLTKYGAPAPSGIPSISKTFAAVTVDGAISKGSVSKLQFQWSAERTTMDYIAFETTDGIPNWHVPLNRAVTLHLDGPGPWLQLSGSGFPQLDGEYFITGNATRLVWVKKDGSGALIFQ